MADTPPGEAAETIRISDSLVALFRQLLLKIVIAYNATYYDKRDRIYTRDGLMGDITFSGDDMEVRGLYDHESRFDTFHIFKDGKWVVESCHTSVPPDDIKDLLKSLQNAVRDQFDGRVEFDTSDNGLTWTVTIFGDNDMVLATYDFGSIGAEGLYFHTCEKVEYTW